MVRMLNDVPEPEESGPKLKSEISERNKFSTDVGSALPPLTTAQAKTLNAIEFHIASRGYPPSLRELADAVDLAKTTTEGHLDALVRKGFLHRDAGEDRGLRILHPLSKARVVDVMPLKKAHICDRCRRDLAPAKKASGGR